MTALAEMFIDRRGFMKLAGYGGVVWVAGVGGCAAPGRPSSAQAFYFVQLSDTHWGFKGEAVNPDSRGTLPKAIAAVNALRPAPDFVVFTGDLTHATDDPAERRRRMAEVRDLAAGLKVPQVRFMPGEHDASQDRGAAFTEYFGATHYSFDHKGVHFIVIDNVSDPMGAIGDEQLIWLAGDLAALHKSQPLIVLTHRPLFDLAPSWDWATRDGGKAIDLLMPFANVTVFYGHIHQEHHHVTGHIAHHAAMGLMFALPAPLSVPKKAPIPWDPGAPYKGLGFREIERTSQLPSIIELPVLPA
jgi:hypothetical protein